MLFNDREGHSSKVNVSFRVSIYTFVLNGSYRAITEAITESVTRANTEAITAQELSQEPPEKTSQEDLQDEVISRF